MISMIFHWFFNEMRPRRPISRACAFDDFPLVFQRNAILAVHFLNLLVLSPNSSPDSSQILGLSMVSSVILSPDLILSLDLSLFEPPDAVISSSR